MPLQTVLIDRHRLFLEIMREKLETTGHPNLNIEATFFNGQHFMDNLNELKCDLVILELNIPIVDGISLIPKIKRIRPEAYICVLSAYSDRKYVKQVLEKGADGYFLKHNTFSDFKKGLEEVLKGYRHIAKGLQITPDLNEVDHEDVEADYFQDGFNLKNKLTRREREILKLIVQAKNNKEIGKELFISDQTVGVHRKNIMRKLGVRNSISLIRFAMDNKLV